MPCLIEVASRRISSQGADVLDVERAADHRLERVIGGIALRDVELGVAQVADARREAEAQGHCCK